MPPEMASKQKRGNQNKSQGEGQVRVSNDLSNDTTANYTGCGWCRSCIAVFIFVIDFD